MKKIISVCLFCFWLLSCSSYSDPIKVGVILQRPFSYQYKERYYGLSIELWKRVAAEMNLQYHLVPINGSEGDALNQLNSGHINALIGPVMVTHQYIKKASFSRPYFINKLGLLYKSRVESFWSVISAIFKETLFVVFLFFIALLVLFTLIFYALECRFCKRNNEPRPRFKSFIWPTIVTLVSLNLVRDSRSAHDRLAVIFWLLLSLSFISIFSALISASLTISHSDLNYSGQRNLKKLTHHNVAVFKGSYADYFLGKMDVHRVYVSSYPAAVKLVEQEQVYAFVGNYVTIHYEYQHNRHSDLHISLMDAGTSEIAFAFKRNDPLRAKVDELLTQLQDNNRIRPVCLKYLKDLDAYFCFI